MILEPGHWYLGYSQILKDCRDNENGSVLILCNADVDAMASARILSYMFRSDGVNYQLLPCMSYSSLLDILANKLADPVQAIVLCNLGATRNLTHLFDAETNLDPRIKVYVMDCRRPVHLANVHADENIVVFWDSVQNEDVPSDGDDLSGNESSSDEEGDDDDGNESSDEDSSDSEKEFDDEGEAKTVPETTKAVQTAVDPPGSDGDDVDDESHADDSDGNDDGFNADINLDSLNEKRRKRHKLNEEKGDDDDDESLDDDEKVTLDDTAVTDASTPPTMTPRERHQDRRDRLRLYYSSGTFYGSPASFVSYRVATQLRFGQVSDLLWLACVGVTDAYLLSRLDVAGYSTLAMDLRSYCERLFPNDMYRRIGNAVYAEHLTGNSIEANEQDKLTKIGFSDNGRILSETDFRFFLLRHTSLFDAMVCSDFVSTRFQLSTSRGMHKLQELLAKMGYPLNECRQPFAFMKPSLRRRLSEQIKLHAEDYGLENFEFTSFFRVTGYQSLVAACDISYAVTALLECETNLLSVEPNEDRDYSELLQAFNIAYDALNSNSAPAVSLNGLCGEGNNLMSLVNGGDLSGNVGIGARIRLAMKLQRTILSTAASLVDRNAITCLSHFRYAYVACTSQGDHPGRSDDGLQTAGKSSLEDKDHVFAKPLALTRLAHYLMDMHRENGKWTGGKARPLILMAEKPRTKSYLVVGYEYPESAGNFVKNRFGKNFELAAQSMKGTFRFDSFDSNVVEVAGSDVQRFIEQLHYLLESIE